MNQAIVGVGSNIQPGKYVRLAVELLAGAHRLEARSRFARTRPIGYKPQPDFLNGAVRVGTPMNLRQFRACLRRLETALGRVRGANKYGPRTIDLDVVVWNGRIIDPDFHRRGFLRRAVMEVWPGA